jgi:hypothetical protein
MFGSAIGSSRQQRQSEGAGLDAGEVEGSEPEPRINDRRVDGSAQWVVDCPHKIESSNLDASDFAVMAYPHVSEAQPAERRLGKLDLS